MKISKLTLYAIIIASLTLSPAILQVFSAPPPAPVWLDPNAIPKFIDPLVIPPVYTPEYVDPVTGAQYFTINMSEFNQQVLPTVDALGNPTGFLPTPVWGYGGQTGLGIVNNQPGPTFEVNRGTPIYVRYRNLVSSGHLFPVDPTLHWANPNNMSMMPPMPWPGYPPGFPQAQSPVPLIPHLHGGEVRSTSDGQPEAWFTWDGKQGPAYNTELAVWWDGITTQFFSIFRILNTLMYLLKLKTMRPTTSHQDVAANRLKLSLNE